MGRSEDEQPHSALLLEMARGVGFAESEIDQLIADARQRVATGLRDARAGGDFARALPVGVARNHELRVHAVALFERDRRRALTINTAIAKPALRWFELHSEVDIRHAEEGVTVIQDYLRFSSDLR